MKVNEDYEYEGGMLQTHLSLPLQKSLYYLVEGIVKGKKYPGIKYRQ